MLPFKKIPTSKSVCLVLIFLSSTTFGFLESDFRDSTSRKGVRGSRDDSFNKEYLEDLPFQRDISRQTNEKDRVYENIYDRRSFRTGTDRHIRIDDKERFLNTRERNSERRDSSERSVPLDTKIPSNNRERFFQERSRTLQNDRIDNIRPSRISRDNRERNHNQRTPSESQERLFVRNNRARQIREQDFENKIQNERSQNSRARQIREPLTDRVSSERTLENQEPFLDYRSREIRERSFENGKGLISTASRDNRFRQIRINNRSQLERSLENRERLAHSENNRARQIREQLTDNRISNERSLENQEPIPDRRVRQIRNTENRVQRERRLEDRKLLVSRDNRFTQIRNNRSQPERRFANVERLANKARQSREQPLTDNRIRNIEHQRVRTYSIERDSRNREQFSERNLENRYSFRNDRRFRQMPERENSLVQDAATLEKTRTPLLSNQRYATDNSEQPFVSRYQNEKERLPSLRYTRHIRQYSQRSLENRDQFLDRRGFRDAEHSIINRERSAENVIRFARNLHDNKIRNTRSVENLERRSIQIRDVRQREQNVYDRERILNVRERSNDLRERSIDTRERNRDNRERSIDTSRSDLQEKIIRNIRQISERASSRLYYARVTDNSNQRVTTERYSRTTPESRRISKFSTRNERSATENRNVRAVKIRESERDSRQDVSRATLSRSDSARQIQDARINLKESAIRQISSNSRTRDEVTTLRSTRADRNSEERQMVPIVEYTPFNRRSFERVDQIRNMKIREKSLKFEAFANVIQVILGVYLIGQIFARSSKKTLFGFEGILPSMVFAKQKIE